MFQVKLKRVVWCSPLVRMVNVNTAIKLLWINYENSSQLFGSEQLISGNYFTTIFQANNTLFYIITNYMFTSYK